MDKALGTMDLSDICSFEAKASDQYLLCIPIDFHLYT